MSATDSTAPSYAELRPLKPLTTPTFPVYPDLVDTLAGVPTHPNATVAHVLATCAGYAYSDANTVAMIMARMGLEDNNCRMIGRTVDAMFIFSTGFLVQSRDGRVLILGYRGTEPANIVNWLTNFDANSAKVRFAFPGAPGTFDVHGGIYRNVRATRPEVVAGVQRALDGQSVLADGGPMPHPLEALYITGHSLGASMAAMLAVMLVTDPAYAPIAAKLRAVYTFGQLMIGTPAFADACNADPFLGTNVIRYVYQHDVAPQFPTRAFGPFAHFGAEYQYVAEGDEGRWRRNAKPTKQALGLLELVEAPVAFLARQLPVLRNVPFTASADDHGPQHYIAALTPPGVRSEFGD